MSTRAFVIGNGPSLNRINFDTLKDEVTFGVNRIHLMYRRTSWRPTYWVAADRSLAAGQGNDIEFHVLQGYPCYIRADMFKDVRMYDPENPEARPVPETVRLFPHCGHLDAERNTAQDWHLPELCCQAGSLSTALQLAFLMDYDPVYVIGCDMRYQANRVNHFDEKYVDPDMYLPKRTRLVVSTLTMGHKIAKRRYDSAGRHLYDATVDGDLHIYPKVDLREVLGNGSIRDG